MEQNKDVWLGLYEAAKTIRTLRPWEGLCDTDLVNLTLSDGQEAYFSVLGNRRELFGINLYLGEKGIRSLKRIANSWKPDADPNPGIFRQECLSFYLGSKEEVPEEERDRIRLLGLRFRGKNGWIYFRKYREYYVPGALEEGDAAILREGLEKLTPALKARQEGGLSLQSGREIFRFEDGELKVIPFRLDEYPEDEPASLKQQDVTECKKKKKTKEVIEASVLYADGASFPVEEDDEDGDERFYVRLAILADHQDAGVMYEADILRPNQSNWQPLSDLLVGYIRKNGRPAELVVPDPFVKEMLAVFSDQLDIPIRVDEVSSSVSFLRQMERDMGMEGDDEDWDDMDDGLFENVLSGKMSEETEREMEQAFFEFVDALGVRHEEVMDKSSSMSEEEFDSFMTASLQKALKNKEAGKDVAGRMAKLLMIAALGDQYHDLDEDVFGGYDSDDDDLDGYDLDEDDWDEDDPEEIWAADEEDHGKEAYTFKVYPSGSGRSVYRVFQISGEATLHDLCEEILFLFGFDFDHLYEFLMDNKPYGGPGPHFECLDLFDGGAVTKKIRIGSLQLFPGQKFTLHYDFGDDWMFVITAQKMEETEDPVETRELSGKGSIEQYPF